METHKKDNDEVSEKTDWGFIFMLLKNRGFTHNEILKLSYPQLNAYMNNLYNELTYQVVIPYLGSGDSDKNGVTDEDIKNSQEIHSKEELLSVVALMNSQFRN